MESWSPAIPKSTAQWCDWS